MFNRLDNLGPLHSFTPPKHAHITIIITPANVIITHGFKSLNNHEVQQQSVKVSTRYLKLRNGSCVV
jgi:hypothetical protein